MTLSLGKLLFDRTLVPGLDFCGRVVQLPSSGVPDELKPDQVVFGWMDRPSKFVPLAEYALVPISGTAPVPAGLAVDDAAWLSTCALTAYQAIVLYVKAGSHAFINGGSGGTGVFAIQIAKMSITVRKTQFLSIRLGSYLMMMNSIHSRRHRSSLSPHIAMPRLTGYQESIERKQG